MKRQFEPRQDEIEKLTRLTADGRVLTLGAADRLARTAKLFPEKFKVEKQDRWVVLVSKLNT